METQFYDYRDEKVVNVNKLKTILVDPFKNIHIQFQEKFNICSDNGIEFLATNSDIQISIFLQPDDVNYFQTIII